MIVADALLISRQHGVVTFALTNERHNLTSAELQRCLDISEQVPSYVHSRLIKNRNLRMSPVRLAFDITPVIYAPFLPSLPTGQNITVLHSEVSIRSFFKQKEPMRQEMFQEIIATIEGTKGLIRPKKRDLQDHDSSSKGRQAELVEAAINLFDHQQKRGIMTLISGPQRIRGLAGSGKTVVLAMKAAQVHLRDPDARIAFTFYTKSLYQHVKRLITRFYRQFDDRDPDWERNFFVLHGWGGKSFPGLYSYACEKHGVHALTFQETSALTLDDRFDFACKELMNAAEIKPLFDYIFVDEGQDFPLSFIRLCHQLAQNGKFVLAYDDLQTIFQATTPSTAEIFGTDAKGNPAATFEEDIVLHKCYRNPREILVSAHALGFGIYSDRIVQMLESREHWEDIGYVVKQGDFTPGSEIKVERPRENSLTIISDNSDFDEIIKPRVLQSIDDEMDSVARSIKDDLEDGLSPEDILVACVDDRNAKLYLSGIEDGLAQLGIRCNNLHSDPFSIRDFTKEGRVSLATVHKAKGNEAFMVYVVGVDAVMYHADVRKRNMLFTAMTRAKGWVRVNGIGKYAERCLRELQQAKAFFPSLVFSYPGPEELKIMKRDLANVADRKMKALRMIEQLRGEYSDDEIAELMMEIRGQVAVPKKRSRTKQTGNDS